MKNDPDGAAVIDLACNRFDDFSMPVTINNDLTGASFESQVRITRDAPGAPLADMTLTSPVVAAGATTFTMSLPEATVEALPEAGEPGDDAVFYWDLQMILAGKRKTLFRGKFTVLAGVTQP
jgi:hypothetical protein